MLSRVKSRITSETLRSKLTDTDSFSEIKSHEHAIKTVRHLLFIQDFHGIVFFSCFVLYEHNAAKGACTKRLDSIEVVESRCVLYSTHQRYMLTNRTRSEKLNIRKFIKN